MLSGTPATSTTISPNRMTFETHVQNMRELKKAIRAMERLAKRAIREKDDAAYQATLAVLATLNGIWAENQLRKLVSERGLIDDATRTTILRRPDGKSRAQPDRWHQALKSAMSLRYSSPATELPAYATHWAASIRGAINETIVPGITERNRVWAHGGWAIPIFEDAPDPRTIRSHDDYVSLGIRRALADTVAALLRELLVAGKEPDKEAGVVKHVERHLQDLRSLSISLKKHDPEAARKLLILRSRR